MHVCQFLYIASSSRLPLVRAEDHETGFVVEEVGEWPELRAHFRLPFIYSAGAGTCSGACGFYYMTDYDDPVEKADALACLALLGAYLANAVALGPVQVFVGSNDEVMWYPLRGMMWATPQDFTSGAFPGGGPPSLTLIEILAGPPKS